MLERAMWTQLLDANHLNRIGPDTSQAPSESFIEREKKHAERLAKLEQLRAVRLAKATPKARRRA
jgi:hypothetical protein